MAARMAGSHAADAVVLRRAEQAVQLERRVLAGSLFAARRALRRADKYSSDEEASRLAGVVHDFVGRAARLPRGDSRQPAAARHGPACTAARRRCPTSRGTGGSSSPGISPSLRPTLSPSPPSTSPPTGSPEPCLSVPAALEADLVAVSGTDQRSSAPVLAGLARAVRQNGPCLTGFQTPEQIAPTFAPRLAAYPQLAPLRGTAPALVDI
jgi:hypothetical protein